MYFAVAHFRFDPETSQGQDRKSVLAVIEKIRRRFRVATAISSTLEDDGQVGIAVAAFAASEQRLTKELDDIANLCETAGLGRIAYEASVVDHLDSIDTEEE